MVHRHGQAGASGRGSLKFILFLHGRGRRASGAREVG